MKKFIEKYKITNKIDNKIIRKEYFIKNYGKELYFLYDIILNYGGNIFDNGLFKIHTFEYTDKWTKLLSTYFEKEINPFKKVCFASNWQGVMYCVDYKNENITYFDPATCEYFNAEFSLNDLFEDILINGEYDIIFEEYWKEAYNFMKIKKLDYKNSIGHKKYLHLDGKDNVKNLEIVNTEVLWEMQIQIAEKINNIK
ncbi:hypothetical protein AGMMS50293_28680 [Spirochaetia bacterium]|nr:hypothetical protein AGMMS50293_28680 [Spirochaetia bacterium]